MSRPAGHALTRRQEQARLHPPLRHLTSSMYNESLEDEADNTEVNIYFFTHLTSLI
jgi:hypothetical protein